MSSRGFETTRTCGLDGESLRRNRTEKAQRAYYLISQLSETTDKNEILKIFEDFNNLGNKEYIFSGMVRTIFRTNLGLVGMI